MQDRFKRITPVVREMLTLFERYEIHATWATVGLLNHDSREVLTERNNGRSIGYKNQKFSPFPVSGEKYAAIPFEILAGADELRWILQTPHQELASHTYAHYYTLEDGQSQADFDADIHAMNEVAEQLHHRFKSIVFPRNQVNETYLDMLKQAGYSTFRGNQPNKDWANVAYNTETRMQKIRRVLDAYFEISKTRYYRLEELPVQNGLVNIPASRFLRPYRGNTFLERRKLKRVQGEMLQAARAGTIYHLWWHPHNFTFEPEKSLKQLEEILHYYKELEKSHSFVSMNMAEIASHVNH